MKKHLKFCFSILVLSSSMLIACSGNAISTTSQDLTTSKEVTSSESTQTTKEKIVITGPTELDYDETVTYTASVSGVEWSVSDIDLAVINHQTGELVSGLDHGYFNVYASKEGYKKGSLKVYVGDEDYKYSRVILMMGQSNMEGKSLISKFKEKAPEDVVRDAVNGYEHTLIQYNNSPWKNKGSLALNKTTFFGEPEGGFGPEVGFAKYMKESEFDDDVYLIKVDQGGTKISSEWRSPSSGQTGSLYSQAVLFIKKALPIIEEQTGRKAKIKAACWMQGESDAASNYDTYQEYTLDLISDLSNALEGYYDGEEINWVDAYISQAWTNYKKINAAKEAVRELNPSTRVTIDTISEGLRYNTEPSSESGSSIDQAHYDSMSELKLGELFAQKVFENFL